MKELIDESFVDKLRSECDIVSVISDYVSLKKKGKNFWGCCPFHNEKTPSFSVTPEKGFFYCFGCHTGGNVFSFLMKIENIGFTEAVRLLSKKMGVQLPEKEKSEKERQKEKEIARLYHINQLARDFFHSCLVNTNYGVQAKKYLATRGVTDSVIEDFKLGFAPPLWDKLSKAFVGRGITSEELLKTGLVLPRKSNTGVYDRFRERVMFSICDPHGRVIGFGGRVIDQTQPKYLNSPETEIFNKRRILYGFDVAYKAIRDSGKAIVVEGYMDAITAHSFGLKNVVASLGTAFTQEQAKLISRFASEIIFAYDSDAAGQNATLRALAITRSLGIGVKVLSIPDGKDPDEFIRKHGIDDFIKLVNEANDLLDYQINRVLKEIDYSTLEGKVAVVANIVPVLAESKNEIEINAHIAHLSQVIDIDEGSIRSEFNKFIGKQKKDKNVNIGKNINIITLPKKENNAVTQAERHIIRMMCEDYSIIQYVENQLPLNIIDNEERKEIINSIFNAYNMGKTIVPSDLGTALTDKVATELSHIMLMDVQYTNNISKMIDDCVKTIQLSHLKILYEKHRLHADELERLGDSCFLQELAESQRIKHEIDELYKS